MSKAVHMAFFVEGLHEAGYDNCITVMHGKSLGCIEMIAEMEQYADYLDRLASKADAILDGHRPGVLDYEVSAWFGKWYGKYILEHSNSPGKQVAQDALRESAIGFFVQDVDEMASIRIMEALKSVPVDAPSCTDSNTSVPVKYWDCYPYPDTRMTHRLEIDDRRNASGQAFVTVGTLDGKLDDMISVTMEINTSPLNGIDQVPCAHVHFDDDNLAASLFKIGDNILVRPEAGVDIEPIRASYSGPSGIVGKSDLMYWIGDRESLSKLEDNGSQEEVTQHEKELA